MVCPTPLHGSTCHGVSAKGLAALFQPDQALIGLWDKRRGMM